MHGTPEVRFSAKVDKAGPIPEGRPELGPCWRWLGYHQQNGYARFNVAAGINVLAHRYVYQVHHGVELPGRESGWELDHLCRNRGCVNPGHLEWVPKTENIRRGDGGKHLAARTHCPAGHPYDEANTRVYDGRRFCRECGREAGRRYRARRRSAA